MVAPCWFVIVVVSAFTGFFNVFFTLFQQTNKEHFDHQ